jgi:hypothetical protein
MLWKVRNMCSCIYIRWSWLNCEVSRHVGYIWNELLSGVELGHYFEHCISVQVSFTCKYSSWFRVYGISLNCLCVFLYYTIYSVQQFNTWDMLRHQLFLFYSFALRWLNWYAAIRKISFVPIVSLWYYVVLSFWCQLHVDIVSRSLDFM